MAPEQIEGQKVDHRADIFSVGAIAYELIAYKRPFDGDTITAVMYKIMHDRADPKALPETEYSPALEEIVMRALARDVRDRYQSLEDMHRDLVGVVRRTPTRVGVSAKPAPPVAPSAPAVAPTRGGARAPAGREQERRAAGQLQRGRPRLPPPAASCLEDKDGAALSGQIRSPSRPPGRETLDPRRRPRVRGRDPRGKIPARGEMAPTARATRAQIVPRRGPRRTAGARATRARARPLRPPPRRPRGSRTAPAPAPAATRPHRRRGRGARLRQAWPKPAPEARRSRWRPDQRRPRPLQNNHAGARKAIDKALAIDPEQEGREMPRILGSLCGAGASRREITG
jgi:serine/threonine-protein kinase